MAYRITEERKKEIVNMIADVTTELKKFDEVKCITWEAFPYVNLLDDFVTYLHGYGGGYLFSNIGYVLFDVVTENFDRSEELKNAIHQMHLKYCNPEMRKITGVDISIDTSFKEFYKIYSEASKAEIYILRAMVRDDAVTTEDLCKYINEKIYNGAKTIKEEHAIRPFKTRKESRELDKWHVAVEVLDELYEYWYESECMQGEVVSYDETNCGYYTRVQHQFDVYPRLSKKRIKSSTLSRTSIFRDEVERELKLKLESNN